MIDYSTLSAPLSAFASYKMNIQNASPLTVYNYVIDLKGFFAWYFQRKGIEHPLEELTFTEVGAVRQIDIYEYLLYVASQKKNGAKARARKLCAIRMFYKYMVKNHREVTENPAKEIDSPSVKAALPRYLSLEESRTLLAAAAEQGGENARRDYAILTLFLNCGMRLAELCGISFSSLADDLSWVRVLGKGSKERVLYLNDACRAALGEYLQERAAMKSSDRDAVFLNRCGNRLGRQGVQLLVQKYLRLAGLDGNHYSVHKLRHTAATLMYSSGKVDVRVLKDILGHEQLNTTQIYTHVNDERMRQALNASPLSGEKRRRTKTTESAPQDEEE